MRLHCGILLPSVIFWGVVAGPLMAADAPRTPSNLIGPWQLFIDDYLVASKTNVTRRYHPFRKDKSNPVADRPRFGRRAMVAPWENDPERKYYSIRQDGGKYFARASSDGENWKQLSDEPSIQGGDTSHFYCDPRTELFRCTVKGGGNDKCNTEVGGMSRRVVGYSETKDITKFPPLRVIMAPDDFDDRWCNPNTVQRTHLYACPVIPYETMYIGLLQIYRAEDPEGYFHGPIWLELVSSRDGIRWLREEGDRPPLLDVGKFRSFDYGMVVTAELSIVGDEIHTYYAGYDELHDRLPYRRATGLATLRKDGFASLDADEAPGEVVTCKFAGVKGPLMVNCDPRKGSLRVELLDAEHRPIPGYTLNECEPMTAASVRHPVVWKNHKELPGEPEQVRFRFVIEKAQLFSFMPGEDARAIPEPPPTPLQILFTFEGETDARVDLLPADGLQAFKNLGTCVLDHKNPDPAFGKRSLVIGSQFRPLNRVEVLGTSDLGKHFTLAAMVKHKGGKPGRLFSAYNGNYAIKTSELIFDFDPRGRTFGGLRLVCKGLTVESDDVEFNDGQYHHLAVTYDDGEVRFYLDGKHVGTQWIPGGEPVKLVRNLMIGEDLNMGSNEQLMGNVDDVLILGWALPAETIESLAEKGAEATLLKK